MVKKLSAMLLTIVILLSLNPIAAAQTTSSINVLVFGNKVTFDSQPVRLNGRILVPVRPIAEAMGADVTFDDVTDIIILQKGSYTITLQVGNKTATKEVIPSGLYTEVDTTQLTLDVPAQIINNRTMVPVRFVAESFDIDVNWNSKLSTVNVGMYLVDSSSKPGWKVLMGHSYENEGVLYVKPDTATGGTSFDYEDLLYDHSKIVKWTDGEDWYQTTREKAFQALYDFDDLFSHAVLKDFFGVIYDEWIKWSVIADEMSHSYERYLNSIDPDKYAITGSNLNEMYDFAEVSITGLLNDKHVSVMAYFGTTMERVSEWCGDPISTDEIGMAGEVGAQVKYMTIADYGPYTIDYVDNVMVGFATDTVSYGIEEIFVGDSIEKIYEKYYVDHKDPTAHQNVYGTTRIKLYLKHIEGSVFKRMEESQALAGEDYYDLEFYYDENLIITSIALY